MPAAGAGLFRVTPHYPYLFEATPDRHPKAQTGGQGPFV
jgi:hypothetical protein